MAGEGKVSMLSMELAQKEEMISMEDLVDELEFQSWEEGTELFKITESFIKKEKSTYLVRYLKAEVEAGMIFMSDLDKIIQNNKLVVSGFLKECVRYVSRYISKETDMYCYKMQFQDGHVVIEPILS